MLYVLSATARKERGEKARTGDNMPAVVYGAGGKSAAVTVSKKAFLKLYKEAGESSLIDFETDGKAGGKVLIQEVQYDPVSGKIIHADLRRIDMKKTVTTMVPLEFVGLAPIIKESGGTLVRNLSEVEVECLPRDLVSRIEVGLDVLKTFNDVIKVKDLILPPGIKIMRPNGDDLVAKAAPAITEEEIKAMEEAGKTADISKIETVEKKKEEVVEEESPAEGEAAITQKPKPEITNPKS